MCETGKIEKPRKCGRVDVWDIPEHQLCTVVGTCLEIKQLRKLKNRFKKYIADMPLNSDYDLHACCVSACRIKNLLSKSINKTINQQFAQYVQEIRGLKEDKEIRKIWLSREPGNLRQLAGYYWAILTSERASADLKNEIYGEVHMISHISGQRSMTSLHEREYQLQQMRFDLKKKDRTIARRSLQIDQIRRVSEGLENQVRYLTSQNSNKETQLNKSQKSPQVYEQIINSQMNCMDRLQTQVDRQKQEIIDLRNRLDGNGHQKPKLSIVMPETVEPAREEKDLCGKKILYVGGFARHRAKFQKLTEMINGCFLYHDGGVQQSVYQLDELIKRADAIFCPIDCISHDAVDRIKTLSKSECKDCVFLRSASLSSFKTRVVQYAVNS